MRQSHSFPIKYKGVLLSLIGFLMASCNSGSDKSNSYSGYIPHPVKLEKQEVVTLKIGEEAPDFSLPDVSGKYYSLEDFKKAKVLVVLFSCNHCPTAQAYEERVIIFTDEYKDKEVELVAISSTSAFGLLPEECGYSDLDDSYESMKIAARDRGYNFPYLYDGDDQAVSIKYGPVATPHAFVFNKERKLVYVGRIDDSEKPGTANAEDLRAAVDAVLEGNIPDNQVNKAFGCSIKWSWKTEWTEKVNKEWEAKAVSLNKIDETGIQEMKENSSEKLRLINVWATWCAPCIIEYPDLLLLQRYYGNRAFEFVSVSADSPEKFDDVLDFLNSKNSAIDNYIFDTDDKYALIECIDPDWNGALPYTLLIEPGGKLVYSNQGVVDLLELKRVIVEHALIGRYF
jgi:thiol-disulfide isomerase/thioredoxin